MSLLSVVTVPLEVVWTLLKFLIFIIVDSAIYMTPYFLRPKKDVSNEIVLITGAGSGFGRLYAQKFTELGSTVVLWDISKTGLQETAKIVKDLGGKAYFYVCDVSKKEEVYRVAADVKRDVGDVTILINNAGVVAGQDFLDTPDHLLDKTIDVNVKAVFWTYKAFAPSIIEKNHGHFVVMASIAGLFGSSKLADYSASKFANVGFEEAMYYELGLDQSSSGVYTTIINPFYSSTGMFKGVQTRFPLILPILEPEYVVNSAMNAILTNDRYVLLPFAFRVVYFLKSFLPHRAIDTIGDFFGSSKFMEDFVGRKKSS